MFDQCHKLHSDRSFAKTLKMLKKKLPPAYPVSIEYINCLEKLGHFGLTYIKEYKGSGRKRFIVQIDTTQCEDMAIETLIHEWAHMISWSVGNNWETWQDDHGPEFGVAFSRVYQLLIDK